jgi:hypothetical protein
LATPNYGYEKRQKELAKKRKKEDKLRAKSERKSDGSPGQDDQDGEAPADDSTTPSGGPGSPAQA